MNVFLGEAKGAMDTEVLAFFWAPWSYMSKFKSCYGGYGDVEEVDPSNVFDLGEPMQHIAGFPNI